MVGKTKKGRNGTGDTMMIYFDPSDPAERRALEASRLLAAKHGRRKQVIVTLLEAIYTAYEQTGDLLSSAEIAAALMGGTPPAANVSPEARVAPAATTRRTSVNPPEEPLIVPSKGKSTATKKVVTNFLSGMGGLLG